MFASATAKTRRLPPSHELWIPHAYQVKAVDFLLERGAAALFLDPGLGKTSITLDAFRQLKAEGRANKMLVVAPLRVCQLVWEQEAKLWTQFRQFTFTFLHGPNKAKLLEKETDIYLINPEGCKWLSDQYWGKHFPFDTVVIDELTRFKNGQAKRHKALLPRLNKVQRRWGLTGTPIPNGYEDLHGQMKILDGGLSLGAYFTHYRNKYFEKDYTGYSWNLLRGARRAIEAAIKPYVLRMADEDYLELPQMIEDIRLVKMPSKARVIYDELKKELITQLGTDTIEAGNAAAAYSKLKQMANGAVYAGDGFMEPRRTVHLHDAKIEAVEELIEELAGTPLLLAYEFNHDLKRLRAALGDVPHIGAGVSGAKVKDIARQWNNNEIPVLLAHPASAAHGLNLQKGNAAHVGWFSTTWDYELYDQFLRRVLRQGNKSTRVFNHIFLVEDTIDNKTRDAILDKGLTQASFFDALTAEIFHDGKPGATPKKAKPERGLDMVRKLSRKSRAEEPEEEIEEELEEEQPRRSRRSTSKRKLRGQKAEEPEEEEELEEEEEPVSKRARRTFSKDVQERLEEEEEEPEEEEPEEEAPTPRRRAKRKKADEPEPSALDSGDINYDELASAILRKLGRFLIALAEQD